LEPGDEVVVWRLDRLGRSLPHLIELVAGFGDQEVGFSSLSEHLDTSTAGGSLIFNIMASLAQFERDLTVERTKAGIAAAQRRGKHCGRPRVMGKEQLELALTMLSQGHTQSRVARVLKVSTATLSRRLREEQERTALVYSD
jgi:DNA invertase Pin-like site-specific DNA recombinase